MKRLGVVGAPLGGLMYLTPSAQAHIAPGVRAKVTSLSENSGTVEGEVRIRNRTNRRLYVRCRITVRLGSDTLYPRVRASVPAQQSRWSDFAVFFVDDFGSADAWVTHCHIG